MIIADVLTKGVVRAVSVVAWQDSEGHGLQWWWCGSASTESSRATKLAAEGSEGEKRERRVAAVGEKRRRGAAAIAL